MKPEIHVNIAVKDLHPEDLSFLSHQNLHPELYFAGDVIDTMPAEKLDALVKDVAGASFSPSIHAPFYDLNLGALDSKIREVSIERILWTLDVAKRFKACQIVVHPGYNSAILARSFPLWLERAGEGLKRIVSRAAEVGVRVAFENTYDLTPSALLTLLHGLPAATAGICFDIGHFNLHSQTTLREWLDTLGSRIFEVHLHDNLGADDDHIAVGDGTVKFQPLFSWLLKQEKLPLLTLEMEQKTHVIKSIPRVREWLGIGVPETV